MQAFSSCGEQRLLSSSSEQASHYGSFSCCRAQALGLMGFSSCSSQALEHRLSSCGAWAKLLRGMWDLPGPGIEPVSPALVGGLFTIEAPGEPSLLFNSHFGLGILPLIFLSFFFLAFQMKWLSHRIMK